jgi:hypothetical protein
MVINAKRRESRKWSPAFWAIGLLLIFCFWGCAAETVTRTSLNRSLLDQESIKGVAVLPFENPPDDFQAGSHISKLFESGSQMLDTGLQISDRIFFNLISLW